MLKLIIFALCTIPACAYAQLTLSGTVVDAGSNQPLAGASVHLERGPVSIADDSGRFRFDDLAVGPRTVTATFIGYSSKMQETDLQEDTEIEIRLYPVTLLAEEVVVSATRATDKTPTTHTTVDREEIRRQNFGQDLPFLLNWTPSVVTTSDAGTGIGYTGIRIRGSDATRINVTINGIPYNDSESQGTFWVDIPDIASSAQSIQIQRGVGTSTNGAGAFGASINLHTSTAGDDPYAEIVNSFGSFNTRRHTLNLSTGLLRDHWIIDGRVSRISSDGFIDRADAELESYYFSGTYHSGNTILKALMFGGRERTYQSWYGVPESRLNNDTEAMLTTAANEGWNEEQTNNLLTSGSRTFNPYLYENQVDDYQQDHFQLHFSRRVSDIFTLNTALHYTPGKGFFEEYRYDADLTDYGILPVTIGDSLVTSSDLVRRRWLDNDFYGATWSLNADKGDWNIIYGGAWNRYEGDHFGEIIWAEIAPVPGGYRYYYNHAGKSDFNTFLKVNYQLDNRLNIFADLQYRRIGYRIAGIENELNEVMVVEEFNFLNPKAGITYAFSESHQLYSSFGIANREPVRDDFTDNPGRTPAHETLRNLEVGYKNKGANHVLHLNYYLMSYRDQLVLTGQVNDVGAPVRTNVPKSYRMGIEGQATWKISSKAEWNGNVTVSQNKIRLFDEVLYDYGDNFDEYNLVERTYSNTDISFSPGLIAGSAFTYRPFSNAGITWLAKYVGPQYLDNTSNPDRRIDPYFINDLRIGYTWRPSFAEEIVFTFLVNNFLNERYESNGYTWGYLAGAAEYRENYYYPQAGRNYLGMITVRF